VCVGGCRQNIVCKVVVVVVSKAVSGSGTRAEEGWGAMPYFSRSLGFVFRSCWVCVCKGGGGVVHVVLL
jgi:hypothetical protein